MAVTINGTTGVAVPLGSAAAPGVVNTTSSTTGIYYPTSTTLALSTNGTNAMTIDASQNITIPQNLSVSNTVAMGSSFLRNRIINGDMRIDQRNAGASVTPTVSAYTVDRWVASLTQSSKYSTQQVSSTLAGFPNAALFTSLSAYSVLSTDAFYFDQRIEGYNVADLAWGTASAQTVTLSFKVYSSLTGTFGGSIRNSGNTRSYPFSYSIPTANTWTTISVTIAGDTSGTWLTTTGIGMDVVFGLGVGSTFSGTAGAWASANYLSVTGATSVVGTNGATFYITGVQFEVGTVATPFERQIYSTQLAQCQRYYEKSYAIGTVPGSVTSYSLGITSGINGYSSDVYVFVNVPFKVTKRTAATFAYWDAAGNASRTTYVTGGGLSQTNNINNVSFATGSETGVVVAPVVTPSYNCVFNWTASAEL